MAFTKYKVVETFKNAATLDSRQFGAVRADGTTFSITANRNNIAVVEFANDDNPLDVHIYFMNGDDLTDARIDAQARDIIASLNKQNLSLAAITVGQETVPAPIDPKAITLQEKQLAFSKASQQAMVNFRNDPAEKAAYTDLLAAQDAVATVADAGGAVVIP